MLSYCAHNVPYSDNVRSGLVFIAFFFILIGVLLPELVVSIILLLTTDAGLMQETGSIPLLAGLMEHVDRFNHLAPGHERDDNEDLAWPGIMGTTSYCLPLLRI